MMLLSICLEESSDCLLNLELLFCLTNYCKKSRIIISFVISTSSCGTSRNNFDIFVEACPVLMALLYLF